MIFRIYHKTLGGHVHMRVFAGKQEGALGKCGDLTMRAEEFDVFKHSSLIDFTPLYPGRETPQPGPNQRQPFRKPR
jgi:hypothetical protein